MIYEYLDIVVYAKLKPTVHEENSKDFVPHRIALCLRVPPSALMSTCQQLHQEISKFQPLLERLNRERPRILVSHESMPNFTDLSISYNHVWRDLEWCFGEMVNAACIHAMDVFIADQDGYPKPFLRNSSAKFLGKEFENEEYAALAAVYTERLAHYLLWRCGNDMIKLAARNIGPEPLLHVAIKLFDTQEAKVTTSTHFAARIRDLFYRLMRAGSSHCYGALNNMEDIKVSEDGKVLTHPTAYKVYSHELLKRKYGIAIYLVYPDVRGTEGISDNGGTVDGLVSFQVTKETLIKRDVSIGKYSTIQQWQADWGNS